MHSLIFYFFILKLLLLDLMKLNALMENGKFRQVIKTSHIFPDKETWVDSKALMHVLHSFLDLKFAMSPC